MIHSRGADSNRDCEEGRIANRSNKSLKKDSSPGELVITPGVSIERILVNMTDPNKEVNGERSSLQAPHPFQADLKVRQAYALAIQRDVMATQLYGDTGSVTPNILGGPTAFLSKKTGWRFEWNGVSGAKQLQKLKLSPRASNRANIVDWTRRG